MKNPLLTLAEKMLGPGRRMRASQFEKLAVHEGDIIFLGDSITEGGLWPEWFPGVSVKNRGIASDTTSGVLRRLETAVKGSPSAVFLLIGTNDVFFGRTDDEILGNIRSIMRRIRNLSPNTAVFLQSIMPRKKKFSSRLRRINAEYKGIAAEFDATWIDLWPALESPEGAIKPTYSLDGLHLNGDGYATWVAVLQPYVQQLRS